MKKIFKKTLSVILTLNLLLQSYVPFLITPVYADDSTPSAAIEATPTPTSEPTPESTPTPTVEATPTPEITPEATPIPEPTAIITPEETPTPTIEVTPSIEVTPTDAPVVTEQPSSNTDSQAPPADETNTDTAISTVSLPESLNIASNLEQTQTATPTLTTDKADYFPTDIAYISGTGFLPNTTYTLHIMSSDMPYVSYKVEVTSDENGNLFYAYQLDGNYRPNYSLDALDASGTVIATMTFTDSVSEFSQCSNDVGEGYSSGNTGCRWINGNLQSNNSAYYEGDATPQRLFLSNLSNGTHTIKIKYGTTKGGKHAYDFMTDDTFSEGWVTASDLCEGTFSNCASAGVSTSALIPTDSLANGLDIAQANRHFKLRNGTITSVGTPTLVSGTYAGDSETTVLITFNVDTSTCVNKTPNSCPVLLSWGAHVSRQSDWGAGSSAVNIAGSPYHVSLEEEDGTSAGSRDNQMQAGAIKGSITLDKVTNPSGDATSFGFTTTGFSVNTTPSLADATTPVTWSNLDSKTYTITESVNSGWTLSSKNCTGGISTVITQTTNGLSIALANGENVVCTFNNTLQSGTLTVQKTTLPAGDTTEFSINASGTGAITGGGAGVITDANDKIYTVAAGTYSVTETVPAGWTQTGNTCNSVVVAAGGSQTCTITNTKDATLTVTKVVVNDNGGTKVVSDFPLFVDATSVTSGTTNTFSLGSHVVSETGNAAYVGTISGDCDANGNVTLAAGDHKSCTITNNDVQPKLTVTKIVVNNHGGTKVISDFPLFVNTTGVISGVQNGFNAGHYTVSETNSAGYTSLISGDCALDGTITLAAGDIKSCTITNTDSAPQLTIIKHVINNNGGTLTASNFTMNVTATNPSSNSFAGDENGTVITLDAGAYSIDETTVSGYAKTLSADCSGTIAVGESKTCTITNDDVAPTLTLTKIVINDNGGTRTVSNFSLFIDLLGVVSGTENTLSAGTYTVSESDPSVLGYLQTAIGGDCNLQGVITLGLGENKVCTITNDDIQPKLVVYKHVINDNGGSLTSGNFTLNVTGTNVSVTSFPGSEVGTEIALDAGTYTVDELANTGYSKSLSADCSGTISVGETKYCTITNDDIAPKLTVTKVVVNAGGSKNVISDFPLYVDATPVVSGVQNTFDTNSYVVSENNLTGFTSVISGDCDLDGSIILEPGDVKACTITNTRDTGSLEVTKYNDLNGNGQRDENEPVLSGWEINLSDENSQTTGEDGKVTFSNLQTGGRVLSETIQAGWRQTNISCGPRTIDPTPTPSPSPTPSQTRTNICHKTASTAHPWNAVSVPLNNHSHDNDLQSGVDYLYNGPVNSQGHPDNTGETWCADNVPAGDNILTKLFKSVVSTVYAFEESIQNLIDNDNNHPVTIVKDTVVRCEIGNQFVDPTITIAKYNDAINDKVAGESVTYRIVLNILDSEVHNLVVKDLLPKGFVYRAGSYQVKINGSPVAISEPVYHSPGAWNVGNVNAGDEIELIYLADISGDQLPGLYPDSAWAVGTSLIDAQVLAEAQPDGYVDTNFSGTTVKVVKDQTRSDGYNVENKVEGQVLGASTDLPATGANELWLLTALLSLYFGLKLVKNTK